MQATTQMYPNHDDLKAVLPRLLAEDLPEVLEKNDPKFTAVMFTWRVFLLVQQGALRFVGYTYDNPEELASFGREVTDELCRNYSEMQAPIIGARDAVGDILHVLEKRNISLTLTHSSLAH